ncbi:MAG: DUF418 domain-containing protein [Anaerolineae bacterium]
MTANLAPVQRAERIDVLDILRGYALFAILIGNMETIRVPYFTPGYVESTRTAIDQLAFNFIHTTLGTELYLVFSFLFGLGFAVQIMRAKAKGIQSNALYLRRMGALFLIGVLHYLLIWDGDILRIYAVFGVVLLLLNVLPDRLLLIGSVVLLLISPVVANVLSNVDLGGSSGDVLTQLTTVYSTGSYFDVVGYRISNFVPDFWAELTFDGLNVLAMFMLGMYAGRIRIFENLSQYRNVFVIGLIGGLAAAIIGDILGISIIHRPGMAALHICGITLVAMYPAWNKRLSVLIPFGRMSLSNYIVQNLVMTTIFYGYGLGQFEKMGAATALLITITIGTVQMIYCAWWLQRFSFGPLEWLWRSLTYGKLMPMRRSTDKPAAEAA